MNNKQGEKRAGYWRRVVSEHERSGLAVRQFCLQTHVNEHTFYNQRKAAKQRQRRRSRYASRWWS